MAFRLSQIKRLLDPVETPEAKATVQPVTTAAAKTLEAPKPVGMSFSELLGGQFGGDGYWDAIKPMFSQLGYSDFLQAAPEFQGAGDSYDYNASSGGRVKQSVLDDLAAKGYTVNKRDLPGDEIWLDLYQNGQKQGEYKAQNRSSGFETFMENGGALAIPFMAAGLFDPNGLLGALGLGESAVPAAALDAATSITPMTAAEVVAGAPSLGLLEAGGLGAIGSAGLDIAAMIPGVTGTDMAAIAPSFGGSSGLLSAVPAAAMPGASMAPMTAAEVAAGAPIASSAELSAMAPTSISSVAPAALGGAPSIAPMTPAEVVAGAPVTDATIAASVGSLPTAVTPAASAVTNSVLADSAAGSAGYGASSAGAGSAASGIGSGIGGALTNVYDFLKANPTIGKLLFSGATGLLSGVGSGSSGGGASEPVYGSPVQWNSAPSVQGQSLLSPVTQAPGMVMPGAIPAQGQQNAGAWRYMRGQ